MPVPEYIAPAEVRRTCQELGISDWSRRTDDSVDAAEAEIILSAVNRENLPIPPDTFAAGLAVELEHGTRFADANVTNNHPLLTGMIVLAHLHESMDYYLRIAVTELEGDLLRAVRDGDPAKTRQVYRRLLEARGDLDAAVAASLAT